MSEHVARPGEEGQAVLQRIPTLPISEKHVSLSRYQILTKSNAPMEREGLEFAVRKNITILCIRVYT